MERRLDIGQEINRHLEWIETVVSLLGSERVSQEDIEDIVQHDRCALGQWLNSRDSEKFKEFLELEALRERHEAFHRMAGELIACLDAGQEEEALEWQDRFIEMSKKVIDSLYLLQEKSAGNHPY